MNRKTLYKSWYPRLEFGSVFIFTLVYGSLKLVCLLFKLQVVMKQDIMLGEYFFKYEFTELRSVW